MKKFFSLIALVGAIAACTPEQLETAFSVSDATAEVLVSVIDLRTGAPYTGSYNIAVNGTPINGGNVFTLKAGSDGVIPEQLLTVSVTGSELSKDQTFEVPHRVPRVLAGGHYSGVAKVIVWEGTIQYDDWTVDIDYKKIDEKSVFGYLVNTHYETYTHSSPIEGEPVIGWYYNNTDFWLSGTVTYEDSYSEEVTEASGCLYPGLEGLYGELENYVDGWLSDLEIDEVELPIMVSAWAMWTVVTEMYLYEWEYKAVATNVRTGEEALVGTIKTIELAGVAAQYYELPYPDAPSHAHYVHGHGHGHGGSNAGGGISYNE